MERTEIRHATDRTVRLVLNRNGYFFLQARKKGLMGQAAKEKRVAFAPNDARKLSPKCMDTLHRLLLGWCLVRLQDEPNGPSPCSERKSMEKKIRRAYTRVLG